MLPADYWVPSDHPLQCHPCSKSQQRDSDVSQGPSQGAPGHFSSDDPAVGCAKPGIPLILQGKFLMFNIM